MKLPQLLYVVLIMITSISYRAQETFINSFGLHPFPQKNNATIFLSPLPGRVNITEDITKITNNKIKNVVMLVSKEELEYYKVPLLMRYYDSLKINILYSPIKDYGLPTSEQMKQILNFINQKIKSKQNVLVHCVGGYGRSGTVMGCYARQYLKKSEEAALQYVREYRGKEAIETNEQEQFVKNWFK